MKTFIDLFCGIGGFRVALERKGLKCVFSSDIDEKARTVYSMNFGEMPHGDITKISEESIPSHDILCAGFPCQSFSAAGNQGGLSDGRGALFYEIIRIAKHHQPKVLLMENVRNILSIDDGDVWKTIRKEIRDIGYEFHAFSLNSSAYGYPQKRERIYIICILNDSGIELKFWNLQPTYKKCYFEDILEENCQDRTIERPDIVIEDKKDTEYTLYPRCIGYFGKARQGERIYSIKGHSVCLLASGGCGYFLIDGKVRRASLLECKRLMGFPDNHFINKGNQGYKQIGNAVMPPMIEVVYDKIDFGKKKV